MIRNCCISDAEAICDIYNYYVANTTITFEESPLLPSDIEERIKMLQSKNYPWLVYEVNSQVIGYAYAGEFKSRCAYRYTLEASLYLSHKHISKGIGTQLYKKLIDECRQLGIHALIGGVAVPNKPSTALHKKFGFQKVAHFPEVGYKFAKWIDVEYWQLLL